MSGERSPQREPLGPPGRHIQPSCFILQRSSTLSQTEPRRWSEAGTRRRRSTASRARALLLAVQLAQPASETCTGLRSATRCPRGCTAARPSPSSSRPSCPTLRPLTVSRLARRCAQCGKSVYAAEQALGPAGTVRPPSPPRSSRPPPRSAAPRRAPRSQELTSTPSRSTTSCASSASRAASSSSRACSSTTTARCVPLPLIPSDRPLPADPSLPHRPTAKRATPSRTVQRATVQVRPALLDPVCGLADAQFLLQAAPSLASTLLGLSTRARQGLRPPRPLRSYRLDLRHPPRRPPCRLDLTLARPPHPAHHRQPRQPFLREPRSNRPRRGRRPHPRPHLGLPRYSHAHLRPRRRPRPPSRLVLPFRPNPPPSSVAQALSPRLSRVTTSRRLRRPKSPRPTSTTTISEARSRRAPAARASPRRPPSPTRSRRSRSRPGPGPRSPRRRRRSRTSPRCARSAPSPCTTPSGSRRSGARGTVRACGARGAGPGWAVSRVGSRRRRAGLGAGGATRTSGGSRAAWA